MYSGQFCENWQMGLNNLDDGLLLFHHK